MIQDLGQLGKYRILAEIGKGGFATVYRALDTTLDREVALKVLDPLLAREPVWAARFQREAKAVARLQHPHVATVYEVGDSEGRLYIAMELITGPSLAQHIAERGRLPWDETLAILEQVAAGLDYAHAEGIIHRDLKPSNILLDPRRGTILTDFGFARLVGESSMSVSVSGGIVGTPAYIAPEVWDGEEPTAQTDLYALGCVAYEMLTGNVLFAGKTPSLVMRQHLMDGPQLPDVTRWPAGVRDVLVRALAKDPAARYASAGALLAALAALSQPTPVGIVTPLSTPQRGKIPTPAPAGIPAEARPRPRWLWPAGGLALLVLLTFLIKAAIGGDQMTPTPPAVSPTTAPIAAVITAAATAPTRAAPTDSPSLISSPTSTPMPVSTSTPTRVAATSSPSLIPSSTNTPMPTSTSTPSPSDTPAPTSPPATVTPTALILTLAPGVTLEVVRIPAGEFLMGSDKAVDPLADHGELPQHPVTLPGYWIGKYEVTVAQFASFVMATSYQTTAEKEGSGFTLTGSTMAEVKGADWAHPRGPESNAQAKAQHPVTLVSWDDAVAFCKWASQVTGRTVRLPSEAEWEKAARGTDGRIYPPGNPMFDNTGGNFNWLVGDTTPVGKYPLGASPYGALDMAGNVSEWTSTLLVKAYPYLGEDVQEDPNDREVRVVRGGSFGSFFGNVRYARRSWDHPEYRDAGLGFRVASSGR